MRSRSWRRILSTCIAIALTSASTLICTLAPSFGQAPTPQALPACSAAGQSLNLDLSTVSSTSSSLIVDPNWTVNGNLAYHTSPQGSWVNLPNWIQPVASSTPQVPPISVLNSGLNWHYQTHFIIPCDPSGYNNLTLQVTYAADNDVVFDVNGSATFSCSNCFQTTHSFTVSAASLLQGPNTLSAVVDSPTGYTGLAVQATLSGTCGSVCPPPTPTLWIRKDVVDSFHQLYAGAQFPMTVTCTSTSGTVSTYNMTLPANTNAAPIAGLAVGSQCSAAETPSSFSLNGYACTWLPKYAPASVTITAGMNSIVVTNVITCTVQSLVIKKVVIDPLNIVPPGTVFPVGVTCTNSQNVSKTYQLTIAGNTTSAPIANLGIGTRCYVSEQIPPPFAHSGQACSWLPIYSSQNVTILGDKMHVVTITNVNSCEVPTGSLSIFKQMKKWGWPLPVLTGPWSTPPTFTINVYCSGIPASTYNLTPPNLLAIMNNLPYGTLCTIEEPTTPPPFNDKFKICNWRLLPPPIQTVVIGAPSQSVTVTNEYFCAAQSGSQSPTGTLTVTKSIRDWNPGWQPQDAFPVAVNCGTAGAFSFTLTGDGASYSIPNLTAGASCTVTETPTNPPLSGAGAWCPALYPQGQTASIQPSPAVTTLSIRNRMGDCTTY